MLDNNPSGNPFCSLFLLIVVDPLCARSEYASIGDSVFEVRPQLQQLVCSLKLAFVLCTAVTNHNLRGVLVGHHNRRLGQARAEGSGVVGLQRLLYHAGVEVVALLVYSPIIIRGHG